MDRSFPHPIMVLLFFILLAGLLTYVLSGGKYERRTDPVTGRITVVAGSYRTEPHAPVGIGGVLLSIPKGFEAGADVIATILIFGGAFMVIDQTGAFKALLLVLVGRFRKTRYLVLWMVGITFAIAGALDNTSEEIIALIPVLCFMTSRLGYSKIGAVAISTGCAVIGASFSPMNPFQVAIAQKIAQVHLLSGSGLRILLAIPAVTFWIYWVVRRTKVQETGLAEASSTGTALPAFEAKTNGVGAQGEPQEDLRLTSRHRIILTLVLASFAYMVYGIINLDWGFDEMTALFFALGLVAGWIGGLGMNGTASAFAAGVKEMILAAFVVGLARSVYIILENGHIIDTIIHGLFTPLQHLPVFFSASGMLLAHICLHLPVSSLSGQAQLTIPILTPLADLTGMSRQVMILAFQYGAGLSELFTPTNGALMGVLAVAGISFRTWWNFIWKPALWLILYTIGCLGLAIAIGF
jgi:uncharacterized ion transporter superfamily protein YfcC